MIVTGLQLTHLRALETAEFRFREGFNLVVGVNGAGKSTVLDALRICLSRMLPKLTGTRSKPMSFDTSDIRVGFPFAEATVIADIAGDAVRYSRLEWKEHVARDDAESIEVLRRRILDTERLRDRPRNLLRDLVESQSLPDADNFSPPASEWRKKASTLQNPPLAVFFATNRSVLTKRAASARKSVGGKEAAYADALMPRPWNIQELADWLRAQVTLSAEVPLAAQHVTALQQAAVRFLPDCGGLRPSDEPGGGLVIEKAGAVLDLRQLSDGERGVLSMVLDLARRLSQIHEGPNAISEARAIVLIDEIDLHLHPKWQREIVRNLASAFPRCQFIATTHSPQVIGEVDHDRIQIIADSRVYSPIHSYGVDANRVLEEVMDSTARTNAVQDLLGGISHLIGQQRFDDARNQLGRLVADLGEDDPEITRIRTLLDFVEGKE